MTDRLQQTQEMLAKHHRDGERFAELMKETFADRHDEIFWAAWEKWIVPTYSDKPLVIDLGTGPGLLLKALAERYPGLRAIGVECAPYMLAAMGPLPDGCEVMSEDLHDPKLALDDGAVDAVNAAVVLHEMSQPIRTMQEVHRVLKPGGRFYIHDWVRAPLEVYIRAQSEEAEVFGDTISVNELDDLFIHFIEHNRFSREDLIYMLNKTGFAVLHSEISKEGRFARIVAEKR